MHIAYVGMFLVDQESPGLQRVAGVSRALALGGHDVVIGGQGQERASTNGRARRPPGPSRGRIDIVGFGDKISTPGHSRPWALDYGVARWLGSLRPRPQLVITYGGTGPFLSAVRRWADKVGVARVIDSVEWYDRRHIAGGRWGLKALDNELSMRWRYPHHDGAIAISRMLEQHLRSHCPHVIRVPPVMDVHAAKLGLKRSTGPLVLLYAGSPGRKDFLGEVVKATSMVDALGSRIRLEVVGTTLEEARRLPGMPNSIPSSVSFSGRVSRAHVLELVGSADYIPLLRPGLRYAHAGFPTKVVEAMAVGTPVIANLTSDLFEHVVHGETGLVSVTADRDGFATALEVALRGGRQLARRLSVAARTEAIRSFDFRAYSEPLCHFVKVVHG